MYSPARFSRRQNSRYRRSAVLPVLQLGVAATPAGAVTFHR